MAARLTLVLGMHRSGTSALTRALHCLGVGLGDRFLGHPCNPKGFFEDADFNACNSDILGRLGHAWHDVAPFDPDALHQQAQGEFGVRALALLREKLSAHASFGLKDPRQSRLLPFWRPLLEAGGIQTHCLLALRHPASVAHSLARRDGMTPAHSHALWLWHLLDAIEGSRGLPCLVVDYDLLLAGPERQVQRMGDFLALPVDTARLREFSHSFLDAALCHHKAGNGMAAADSLWADMALRLHDALQPAAQQPAPLEDWPGLPRLLRLCQNLRHKALRLPSPAAPLRGPFAEGRPSTEAAR